MGVGQLIRNAITAETDPTVASFTKSLTSNNTILTAVNAAIGANSLQANTTGNNCSAFGVSSLQANTTGNNCSAFGVASLRANTTGSNCSAFGVSSLRANTTGSNCSAFGATAGRFQSDGVTEISVTNNSCFFGVNTKGTQNATNENVFGFNATGNGSNTVTIGDPNITNTYLKGVVSTDSTAASTSTTTGAIRAASLGITGAIFAGSLNGNGSGLTSLNASNISVGTLDAARLPDSDVTAGTYNNSATQVRPFSIDVKGRITSIEVPVNIYLPYQRINMTESIPPVNDSSPGVNTICNMGVFSDDGYPLTGHLFSSVASSIRGIQIITNPLNPESSYIRSRHTNFATGWSSWQKIAIENTNGIILSSSGFSVGSNQVVSARRTGWSAPTGTATRTTFATSTVTLPQLAERVKALIDDLINHGLIGA